MIKIIFSALLVFGGIANAQTRNIVPRTDNAGNIGLSTLTWHGIYANKFYGNASSSTYAATTSSDTYWNNGVSSAVTAVGWGNHALGGYASQTNLTSTAAALSGHIALTGSAHGGIIPSSATGTYPLSISGNATTATTATTATNVTTNANLTGPITSVGNATAIVGPIPVSTIDLSTVTTHILTMIPSTATGSYPLSITGTVAQAGVNLSTVTSRFVTLETSTGVIDARFTGVRYSTDAIDTALINLATVTAHILTMIPSSATGSYPLSITGAVSQAGVNLSTVTANHVLKSGDTMSGPLTVSTLTVSSANGEFGVRVASNVYIVGYSSATTYYGDGSKLTGIVSGGTINSGSTTTWTGSNTWSSSTTFKNVTGLKTYIETASSDSVTGATFNVEWSSGSIYTLVLKANTTLTFSGAVSSQTLTILTQQDAVGTRLITWPTITWIPGVAPTLQTAANSIDAVTLYYNGSSYLGFYGYSTSTIAGFLLASTNTFTGGNVFIGTSTFSNTVTVAGASTFTSSVTIISSMSITGTAKLGTDGVAFASAGVCTSTNTLKINTTDTPFTCTGLPAAPVAVVCSGSTTGIAKSSNSCRASAAGTVNCLAGAVTDANTWYCMWMKP